MDLDQLHTFLEIVRLKSFSKAAQTCYRTQPAISAQVRQLEQELNTTLFERLGTRIALTTAGKIFAEHGIVGLPPCRGGLAPTIAWRAQERLRSAEFATTTLVP